jgi:tetratricopeptide (TPR) repeat protein
MMVRKADKLYEYGEYYEAAAQYGKAYRRLSSQEKALRAHTSYYRGESFRKLNQSVKAENEYRKALRYAYLNDTLLLRIAQTLHKNGRYEEAASYYTQFLQKHPDDILAINGIASCQQIKTWLAERPAYQVSLATAINTRKSNFSPALMPPDYNHTTVYFFRPVKKR